MYGTKCCRVRAPSAFLTSKIHSQLGINDDDVIHTHSPAIRNRCEQTKKKQNEHQPSAKSLFSLRLHITKSIKIYVQYMQRHRHGKKENKRTFYREKSQKITIPKTISLISLLFNTQNKHIKLSAATGDGRMKKAAHEKCSFFYFGAMDWL